MNQSGRMAIIDVEQLTKRVSITGFRDAVEDMKQQIEKFLSTNAEIKNVLTTTNGKLNFIREHYSKELLKWNKEVAIDFQDRNEASITIMGTDEAVRKCFEWIDSLIKTIVDKPYPVRKPGVGELFQTGKGIPFIETLQSKEKCFIEIDTENANEKDTTSGSPSRPQQILCQHFTPIGQKILVVHGDITKEGTDAIVNAANTKLRHGAGIAKATVDAGGREIQEESDKHLKDRQFDLFEGEVACTGPGKLPCKIIVHVAGPQYQRLSKDSQRLAKTDILHDCITSVLRTCEQQKLISVAIPAISSGIFGFPLMLSTKTIVQAVCEFYSERTDSSLQEIKFIANDESTSEAFKNALNNEFKDKDVIGASASISDSDLETKLISDDQIKTLKQMTATLKKTSIADENVDVIVNSIGMTGHLNQGAVSKSLFQAAGKPLQHEVDNALSLKPKKQMKHWQFIQTKAPNLKCRMIYHACCNKYEKGNPKNSERDLCRLLSDLLNEANRNGMKSIALPALATGALEFPHNIVARIMFDAALEFRRRNPSGTLTDIRFILYKGDELTIGAFEGVQARVSDLPLRQPTRKLQKQHTLHQGTANVEEDSNKPRSKGYNVTVVTSKSSDRETTMQFGNVLVKICGGNIIQENTEAIVNSTSPKFTLNYFTDRGVIRTSAGRLTLIKHIIHTVITPNAKDLRKKLRNAMLLAEECEIRSIAFPSIGTGEAGVDPIDAARILIDAIGNFATTNPRHLLLVKVTIFDPEILHSYMAIFQSMEGFTYKPEQNWNWKKIVHKFKHGKKTKQELGRLGEIPVTSTVIFHIFAESSINLDRAERALENFIEEEYTTEVVPYDRENGELTEQKMQRLERVAEENQTWVRFTEGKAKRIVLIGRKDNVRAAHFDVLQTLLDFKNEEKRDIEDALINKNVQWQYKDDTTGQYHDYDKDTNPIIERNFNEKHLFVDLLFEEENVRVDFHRMEEIYLDQPKNSVKVRRMELETIQGIPAHWDSSVSNGLVPVAKGSEEYKQTADHFKDTSKRDILTIERVQNRGLHQRYTAFIRDMERKLPSGVTPEKFLFHGTSADTCDKINRSGFNRSYCGKNGDIWGKGSYFARDAKYSERFAGKANSSGHYFMYRCKVFIGEYTKGHSSYITPPPKPSNPSEQYDSVVNDPDVPTIFVAFHDDQAYPEYLIKFK